LNRPRIIRGHPIFSGSREEFNMDLGDELVQALRAYADGFSDAQTTYLRLTRLGPALDASGDAGLMDRCERAFTLTVRVEPWT
jgi:hypothetical protein